MSGSNDDDPAMPRTPPPVIKTKTFMGDQSIGGTVYIRPRPKEDVAPGSGPDEAASPKALGASFAAATEKPAPTSSTGKAAEARTPADPPAVNAPRVRATASDATKPSAVPPPGEVDEELRMAEALALAIQSNPTMSAEEIKQLIGVNSSVKNMPEVKSGAATAAAAAGAPLQLQALAEKQQQAILSAGQKFSSLLQAAVDNSSENAKKATNQGQETLKALSKSLSNLKPPAVAIKWNSGSSNSSIKLDPVADGHESHEWTEALEPPSTAAMPETTTKGPTLESKGGIKAADANTSATAPVSGMAMGPMQDGLAAGRTGPMAGRLRLSGLVWKRRGGMGKYTASAWELRRFELHGTKLMYFQSENIRETSSSDSADRYSPREDASIVSNDDGMAKDSEGVVINRRTSWFEQATATWNTAVSDPNSPRGGMDLAKEKATLQVSYGHSGAPSPFALSIKVGGDTKWKLCFSQHKILMEWLAALSDVVVQCSIDQYNAGLLAAADPSNQNDLAAALYAPPAVHRPPGPNADKAVNRLWMRDVYRIESSANDDIKDDDEHEATNTTVSLGAADELSEDEFEGSSRPGHVVEPIGQLGAVEASIDHSAARAIAEDKSEKVWSVPEHNLRWLAGLVNAALFLARSSSVPVEGFWYIVVVANLGLYLCLVKEPAWRSLLMHVKAIVPPPALGTNVIRKKLPPKSSTTPVALKLPPSKPIAGTTTVQLNDPKDPPVNAKNEMFAGWRAVQGESVLVRSHGYNSTKAKVASPGELYELVNVDIFESPSRYPEMATRVVLPKCNFDDGGEPKTWRTPDIFIISIALPTDPPSAFAKISSDGGGYTITMYYRMHQDTRDILRRVTADDYDPSQEKPDDPQKSKVNAVRLMEEWVRRAPSDPKYQARFKVITNAHNLEEIGMPAWIAKYNGKPFLVKRAGITGFLYNRPELSCVEFDVSLHAFPYLCKQAICFMKESFFKKLLVTFAFTIEGRSDDELPECVIGLMQLCYPNPEYAIKADAFFAGTAPKSF